MLDILLVDDELAIHQLYEEELIETFPGCTIRHAYTCLRYFNGIAL
jgi:hypothetical protein